MSCINHRAREHAVAMAVIGQCPGSEVSVIHPDSPVLSHSPESYQKHKSCGFQGFSCEKRYTTIR